MEMWFALIALHLALVRTGVSQCANGGSVNSCLQEHCGVTASPSVCVENGHHDGDCCAMPGTGSCEPGYTFSMSREKCHWIGAHTSCCIPNGGLPDGDDASRRRRRRRRKSTTQSTICNEGFSEHYGECYLISPYRQSHSAAQRWCRSKDTALVSIHSQREELGATAACGRKMCWLGLTEVGGDEFTPKDLQTWRWEDGSLLAYANWQPGEPNNYGGRDEKFAFMNLDIPEIPRMPKLFTGHWFDGPQELRAHALCKLSNGTAPSVPDESQVKVGPGVPGKSNRYTLLEGRYTAEEALTACGKGKRLAMPKTERDVQEFTIVARSVGESFSPDVGFFLGGHQTRHGRWIWNDGSRIAKNLWFPGQPGNNGLEETQLCTWAAFDGKFHDCPDHGPWGRLRVACEEGDLPRDKAFMNRHPSGMTKEILPGSCQSGFAQHGDGCYLLHRKTQNFFKALEWCRLKGADLASIHDEEENDIAKRVCGQHMCWIGLSERGGTASTHKDAQVWRWEDGSDLLYENWHPGEPNNYGGNDERYVFMNLDMPDIPGLPRLFAGDWFDGPSGVQAHALCWSAVNGSRQSKIVGGISAATLWAVLAVLILTVCTCLYFRNRITALLPYMFGYKTASSGTRDVSFPPGNTIYCPPVVAGQPVVVSKP